MDRAAPVLQLDIDIVQQENYRQKIGRYRAMIPVAHAFPAALPLIIALSSAPIPPPPDIPVLEVVKVYGRLAGPECYGLKAPAGSSCQARLEDIQRALDLRNDERISKSDFASRLEAMNFQWPLKPYGVDKSLAKTAVMNKGAETRVFMNELESRGLYDRRNPTGPLPTSLRPALNKKLQAEGLDPSALDLVFQAFAGVDQGDLSAAQLEDVFGERKKIDYYDFLKALGTDSILWPN